jgi:1-acyl-sn-glycerol-3-phosphate acyltransferase
LPKRWFFYAMKTLLSYLLTPIFYLCFGSVMVVFDPIQRISLNLFGHKAHDNVITLINYLLMGAMRVLGAQFQSMYDMPGIFWYFRKHHPKFVVKKELAKGIPTISYNVRRGGTVTIDRQNPKQAIVAIYQLAHLIQQHKFAAVIFPEGTRSRSGAMKPFKPAGLQALLKKAPDALLVPLTINNTYKFTFKGMFPLALGVKVSYYIHEPLENKGDHLALIATAEEAVRSKLQN